MAQFQAGMVANAGGVHKIPSDILGADDFPLHPKTILIKGSQTVSQTGAPTTTTLLAGSVLGIITSGGRGTLVTAANSDGSQTPAAVLPIDIETSGGDVVATVYTTGSFLISKLLFGSTDTYATHSANLEKLNIYGETSQSIADPSWNS